MEAADSRNLAHSARSSPTTGLTADGSEGAAMADEELCRSATRGTVVSSMFILLTTCIGAGTLSLPYAFSQGGIFVFSIIFFLIMVSGISRWLC